VDNTPANETTAVGPYMNWPVGPGIGFDYFYGFLAGECSQYEPAVVEKYRAAELTWSDPRNPRSGRQDTADWRGTAIRLPLPA
jgi:arylsulfatase A-like enzyme